MGHKVKEKCPNCKEQNPAIGDMPDGSCGVCAGKGYIVYESVGKLVEVKD